MIEFINSPSSQASVHGSHFRTLTILKNVRRMQKIIRIFINILAITLVEKKVYKTQSFTEELEDSYW